MLKACLDCGVKTIRGVDGSWVNKEFLAIPEEFFTQYDLSKPGLGNIIPEKFDLTISLEVAEHINSCDTEAYMDNLTSFSDVILFSAAIPGQGGTHHVNEQWPSYWIEKFAARNFVPVDCIRAKIWNDNNIYFWYRQNIMFFVRETALKNYPLLMAEAGRPVNDIVHPVLYETRINHINSVSNAGFKTICKNIIPSFIRAIKRRLI